MSESVEKWINASVDEIVHANKILQTEGPWEKQLAMASFSLLAAINSSLIAIAKALNEASHE